MDRILTKIVYIVFQVLKVVLTKICKIQSLDLLFLVVLLAFVSAVIICYKFVISTLSEKEIFVTNFLLLRDLLKPLPQLHSQSPLSVTKFFCQCSLTYLGFSRLLCYSFVRRVMWLWVIFWLHYEIRENNRVHSTVTLVHSNKLIVSTKHCWGKKNLLQGKSQPYELNLPWKSNFGIHEDCFVLLLERKRSISLTK